MENNYLTELDDAMYWLSQQEKTIWIGQSVKWAGHSLFSSMTRVPVEKRIELPVMEDFQFGISIGLAMAGFIPINIYPRSDFLVIASNQIANHLANIRLVSDNKRKVKVITRVSVGGTTPMHPGLQHCQDHTEAIKLMCRSEIDIVELKNKNDIMPAYQYAYQREDIKSTILVEYMDLYHT